MRAYLFRNIKHRLRRTVEPLDLPVTIADLKLGINYGTTTEEDDARLNRLQSVAVEKVEIDSQRALMPQTWVLKMDEFPDVIELRRPPILTVASVAYLDTAGVSQTLSSTLYDTDLTGEPGRIMQAEGATGWPTTDCAPNAVTVTFTAGYSAAIPQSAYYAICLAVTAMLEGCEPDEAYWRNIERLQWEGRL